MSGLFNLDSPFARFCNMVVDILLLSLIWLLFCIPIITVGASTTAIFYVTTRRIANKEQYLFRDFYSSFKANFFPSTLIWLIQALLVLLLVFNIFTADVTGDMAVVVFPISIFLLAEVLVTSTFIYPIAARFDMKFTQIVKTAFFMANRHFFTSLICISLGTAIILLMLLVYPPLLLCGMGIYSYCASLLIVRVFRKYKPEMDENPEAEAIKAERRYMESMRKNKKKWYK